MGQARARGVIVSPSEDSWRAERERRAVRVCLGATSSRARLEEGLGRLAELLEEGPEPSLSVY